MSVWSLQTDCRDIVWWFGKYASATSPHPHTQTNPEPCFNQAAVCDVFLFVFFLSPAVDRETLLEENDCDEKTQKACQFPVWALLADNRLGRDMVHSNVFGGVVIQSFLLLLYMNLWFVSLASRGSCSYVIFPAYSSEKSSSEKKPR